jgi:hypothetical protein
MKLLECQFRPTPLTIRDLTHLVLQHCGMLVINCAVTCSEKANV